MAVAQKRNPPKKSTQGSGGGGGGGGLRRPQTAPGRPGSLEHARTLPAGMGAGSDLAAYSAGGPPGTTRSRIGVRVLHGRRV